MVFGAAACLATWAIPALPNLYPLGAVGIIAGVVRLIVRIGLDFDKVAAKVENQREAETLAAEDEQLRKLLRQLRFDRDPRTDSVFLILKTSLKEFRELNERSYKIGQSLDLPAKVDKLFKAAVIQLEKTLTLQKLSERLYGQQREQVLAEREAIIQEVSVAAEQIKTAVQHLREVDSRSQDTDLTTLRDELDESLRIAAAAQSRMNELERERE